MVNLEYAVSGQHLNQFPVLMMYNFAYSPTNASQQGTCTFLESANLLRGETIDRDKLEQRGF